MAEAAKNRGDHESAIGLFKAAIHPEAFHIDPADICALATLDEVESRMIGPGHELLLGPFDNPAASASEPLLPAGHLLLVQCLEQHLESAAALLDGPFQFLPRWQVDDVMASLGDSDASCGEHFDHYDVFLFQHTGEKTWYLDDGGHTEDALSPEHDIRLLSR